MQASNKLENTVMSKTSLGAMAWASSQGPVNENLIEFLMYQLKIIKLTQKNSSEYGGNGEYEIGVQHIVYRVGQNIFGLGRILKLGTGDVLTERVVLLIFEQAELVGDQLVGRCGQVHVPAERVEKDNGFHIVLFEDVDQFGEHGGAFFYFRHFC